MSMGDSQKHNLKNALAQLKISIHEINLVKHDILEHTEELDAINENLENAILLIKENL
jgi:hypothetical protein